MPEPTWLATAGLFFFGGFFFLNSIYNLSKNPFLQLLRPEPEVFEIIHMILSNKVCLPSIVLYAGRSRITMYEAEIFEPRANLPRLS